VTNACNVSGVHIGIDVGGLFKDFLTDLSERVFDPGCGLFCLTPQQQLYPHPSAAMLLGQDDSSSEMEQTFAFIGRVLGKGEWERGGEGAGITEINVC
jgi:hypothetical protein